MKSKHMLDWCFSSEDSFGNVTAEVDAKIHYTFYPGDPGRISGPPERCYPPEPPEVEIDKIEVEDFRSVPAGSKPPWRDASEVLGKDNFDTLWDHAELIEEDLIEHAARELDDAREYAAEIRAEDERERRILGD